MGKSSFDIIDCIEAFILSIYLLFLMIYRLVWLISAVYKKLSESLNKTEPAFHWKKYQSYTQDFNSNHSKKKRTYHKTHSYETQGNNYSKKEYYQKSNLKAFRILNLRGNESEEEIKKAYRKAVKKWHPDNNKDWCAEKKFIEIHDAYKLLLNLKKAGRYKCH